MFLIEDYTENKRKMSKNTSKSLKCSYSKTHMYYELISLIDNILCRHTLSYKSSILKDVFIITACTLSR